MVQHASAPPCRHCSAGQLTKPQPYSIEECTGTGLVVQHASAPPCRHCILQHGPAHQAGGLELERTLTGALTLAMGQASGMWMEPGRLRSLQTAEMLEILMLPLALVMEEICQAVT